MRRWSNRRTENLQVTASSQSRTQNREPTQVAFGIRQPHVRVLDRGRAQRALPLQMQERTSNRPAKHDSLPGRRDSPGALDGGAAFPDYELGRQQLTGFT